MKEVLYFKAILIPGFRRDVDEICYRLGYYAVSCGNCLPTFRDNVSVPVFDPWIWYRSVDPKIRNKITTRRRVISQKIVDLIKAICIKVLENC
jgi:hypothetical protein